MDQKEREERDELRDLVRQMHESLKDGHRLLKAMETIKDELMTVAEEVFSERMGEQVAKGLDEYKSSLDRQIELATQKVYERFDTIADILLGKNQPDGGIEGILDRVRDEMKKPG